MRNFTKFAPSISAVLFLLGIPTLSLAHPIPDLPVFGTFDRNGTSSVLVEVDPRAFSEDPEAVPFLTVQGLKDLNQTEQNKLLEQAKELLDDSLRIRLNEDRWYLPDFSFEFASRTTPEVQEEPVVFIQAQTHLARESNATYQIKAQERAPLDLIFTNRINGVPHRRVNVLFPGEESFVLKLPTLSSTQSKDSPETTHPIETDSENFTHPDNWSTFSSFLRQGFLHVLPLGLDHILFVLGLFFLSRKWKPLIYQVSCFTVAHTITLGMATLNWVSVPASIVEPIISASIAFVALENIFFPAYHRRRLLIVFFFGLIHGLGFAGALSDLRLDPSVLVLSLIGFNLGVEGGQLAVILIALTGVFRFKEESFYRKVIVIPGSLLIAGLGIFWTIQRIWF